MGAIGGIPAPCLRGGMYYEYEQDSAFTQNLTDSNLGILGSETFEVSAILPIVGGGGTFFIDRFFLDVYGQHAFEQDDNENSFTASASSRVTLVGGESQFSQFESKRDVDIERNEWAVSVGYSVTDNFALFAGYRSADTDLDSSETGKTITDNVVTNPPTAQRKTADVTQDSTRDFDQKGPFVGFGYGLPLKRGIFDGIISFDLAVAKLDGDVTKKTKNRIQTNVRINGVPQADRTLPDQTINLDGDAIGLNLGFHWKGFTPVKGLSYMIDIVGHRYDFESDSATLKQVGAGDFDLGDVDYHELVISSRLGLSYNF